MKWVRLIETKESFYNVDDFRCANVTERLIRDGLYYALNSAMRNVWGWRGRELEVPGSFSLVPRLLNDEDLRRWDII